MIAVTTDQAEIAGLARALLSERKARQGARRTLEHPVSDPRPAYWDELAGLGWLGVHLPIEFGGAGLGLTELCVVLEELGASLSPGPFLANAIASAVVAAVGTPRQQARFLPGLADGSRNAVVAGGGSLAFDGARLEGISSPGLGSHAADLLILLVGPDLVVSDAAEAAGLHVQAEATLDPTQASATVVARAAAIDAASVVAGGALAARGIGRLLASAQAVGGQRACLEMAVAYAKIRQQFGRSIGTFQAVKHRCADLLVAAELAAAAVWGAARIVDSPDTPMGTEFGYSAAVAATQALPAFLAAAQANIQVHGGIGFTWEHDAHLYLRRAAFLLALSDPGSSAEDVSGAHRDGIAAPAPSLNLPPQAAQTRAEVRRFTQRLADLPDEAARQALILKEGYIQPHWPRPWGRGATALEQLIIDEEFAQIPRPDLGIGTWILETILAAGTPEQIDRWLGRSLRGELVWCQLFSEPEAGSDAAGIATRAVRVDGGWRVTGQKVWTSGGPIADQGLATVRTSSQAAKHRGITVMVVDMHANGVTVRPIRDIAGESRFSEVFLSDVFVPDTDVLGAVGEGWAVARRTLGAERLTLGASASYGMGIDLAGIYRRAAEVAPALRSEVGTVLAEAQALRLLNLRSAQRAVDAVSVAADGHVTKLVQAENVQRRADVALRLLGRQVAVGRGDGEIVARSVLHSRMATIAGGTSEIVRNQIAERVLGLPRDPLLG
jgi:alkylation response protein AidB-like acyl-CoA dehydrogenase